MRIALAAAVGVACCWCVSARAQDFNVAALPGLQWWASAADSQLAQNPDGSGAVTSGSSVGYISDLSGNGRNAVMGNAIISAGDTFRPQYQSDVAGFEPGILFNGSTDFMSLQSAFFNGASSETIAIAVEADSFDDTKRNVLGGGNMSLGFTGLGLPDASFLQSNGQSAFLAGSTFATLNGSQGPEDTEILIARYQAGGDLELWANGVLAGSMPISAFGPTSTAAPSIPLLGNTNFATDSTGLVAPSSEAGGFYFLEGMATSTALSDSQISQLYTYLSAKYPGVQPTAESPNLYWNSSVNPQETPPTTSSTAGHIQGVAAGGNDRFVFYTGVIAEFDSNWNLLNYNQSISPSSLAVHCGDGDYVAGKIFAPLETSFDGDNGCIAVYDATKPGLPLITSVSITSHIHEFSGLVVVPSAGTDGIIFGTSYYASAGGTQLWMYNYADGNVLSPTFGAYLGNLQIPSSVTDIQGVAYKAPYFYFSGLTLDRVLYQNGVLSSQSQVVWQTGSTVQGLTVSGSSILQVLQGGSAYEVVATLTSNGFTQMSPTGFNAWNLNGNSNFGNTAAWNSSVPDAAGAALLFGDGTGTWVHADSVQITVDGAYTAGSLSFDTTAGTSYSLAGDGQPGHGITLNSGSGSGVGINVYSGSHSIGANLSIADAGGLTFDIVSGSALTIGGCIGEVGGPSSLTLVDSGTLVLANTNSYSGGTTVRCGALMTTANGSLGSGPLTINAAEGSSSAVSIGGIETISALSGTIQPTGSGTLTITRGASLTVNQNGATDFQATLVNSGSFVKSGSGTLELDSAPTLGSNSSIQVTGQGGLKFNVTVGAATIGAGATVTVSPGATLQLAGTVSALSSAGASANIVNNGSAASGGGLLVTGANQSVGFVSGTAIPVAGGATLYSGDTVVGDGIDPANLSATQILQDSLIVNAGATVTINPTGGEIPSSLAPDESATAAIAASDGSTTNGAASAIADESGEALSLIQAAIASGSISSAAGRQWENRIASIERLAMTDPNLDATYLENRVLAMLQSAFLRAGDNLLIGSAALDIGSGLLNVTGGEFAADSSGGAMLESSPDVFNGTVAAPEPASLLLTALGVAAMPMLRFARRRRTALRPIG